MREKTGRTVRRAAFTALLGATALGGLAMGGHFFAQAQPDASFTVQPKPGAIQPSQLNHPAPRFCRSGQAGEARRGVDHQQDAP